MSINNENWEFEYILAHKGNPVKYPLNRDRYKKLLEEQLLYCEYQMILGENWHGGTTIEEAKKEKIRIETLLKELKNI